MGSAWVIWQFLDLDQTQKFHSTLIDICTRNNYTFKSEDGCKSAPQLFEGYCYDRIPQRKNGGYCSSFSLTFALLYLRSSMTFKELDKKLGDLIERDPCALISLFTILSDLCCQLTVDIYPEIKEKLLYYGVDKVDLADEEWTRMGQITYTSHFRRQDLELIISQVDLIIYQFKDQEYSAADAPSCLQKVQRVSDSYDRIGASYQDIIETYKKKMDISDQLLNSYKATANTTQGTNCDEKYKNIVDQYQESIATCQRTSNETRKLLDSVLEKEKEREQTTKKIEKPQVNPVVMKNYDEKVLPITKTLNPTSQNYNTDPFAMMTKRNKNIYNNSTQVQPIEKSRKSKTNQNATQTMLNNLGIF